ncbi:MAG TPA: hypothetical protein PK416_12320, partial [Thermodesulfobacteriota bacterium]|nr:hypothetical protein [Thermodesulfobacteriota bacterium]
GNILGLCTKCHDPHGVDTAKTDSAYMVPALKGTWMTSPYKEDRAGDIVSTGATPGSNYNPAGSGGTSYKGPRQTPLRSWNRPAITGGGYGTTGGSNGYNGYFIDENTFGSTLETNNTIRPWSVGSDTVTYITQTDTQFGGLCMQCHPKTGTGGIGTVTSTNGP